VRYVDGLMIANNAFYGEAPSVQIGSAVVDGQIDVVANTIVDGSIYVTVRPGSAATVSIIGNVLSGERPFGDFPFGINGSGFWADPLPSSVLEGLNNVGEGNDIIAGGPGNDELGGGGGSDTLDGGPATTSSWATEPSPRRVPVSPGMTP
jgi:Ca2+-binding RTX toxin-like protein